VSERLRIAWLTTGRGPGSYGALEYTLRAIDEGLPVEIAAVFVNRERGHSVATDRLLDLVEARGIPLETLSSARFRKERGGALAKPGEPLPEWRRQFDEEVAERLARYGVSLGVTFGYMMIATEPLYERFTLINDHPALPDGPTGTYQEVIEELMRRGATESGAMMNIVTGDLDRGPVVSFCRFAIRDDGSAPLWDAYEANAAEGRDALYDEIRARSVARERPLVVATLEAIATGRLAVPPAEPLDLSAEVESRLAAAPA
jgi:folate-dependent phosphoribosylglycinamide formyltransferase PurN